jgi:hypothetical protein
MMGTEMVIERYKNLMMGTEMVPERHQNLMLGTEIVPERHPTLMVGIEIVPQTSVIFNQLIWLITRDDSINFSRRERYRSYMVQRSYINR